jgi:RNA polymerase sigma-70 factor (ECF subfamily)
MDALFPCSMRLCGDIDDAEEAVQDAFRAAVERWPSSGIPPSPAGWIIATARNRAIDRHRRTALYEERDIAANLASRRERSIRGGRRA